MHPDEKQAQAVLFLRNAVAYYARLGITVQRLLTDNGAAFRSREFRANCIELGIKHSFTRPYRPQTHRRSSSTSCSTTQTPNAFIGPSLPMTSSQGSRDFACELLTQDTRESGAIHLVYSAKLHGHGTWSYLKDVLERLPTHPNHRIDELLPYRWAVPLERQGRHTA